MGFLKKLSSLLSGSGSKQQNTVWITVKCNRCGEVIRSRVNLFNDLSISYDDGGEATYFCHKTLIGEPSSDRPCFQRIEVELTFDANRKLLSREISGGQFIENEPVQ